MDARAEASSLWPIVPKRELSSCNARLLSSLIVLMVCMAISGFEAVAYLPASDWMIRIERVWAATSCMSRATLARSALAASSLSSQARNTRASLC